MTQLSDPGQAPGAVIDTKRLEQEMNTNHHLKTIAAAELALYRRPLVRRARSLRDAVT